MSEDNRTAEIIDRLIALQDMLYRKTPDMPVDELDAKASDLIDRLNISGMSHIETLISNRFP